MELEKYFEVAQKLVDQAGEVIREAIEQKKNVTEKNSMFDLVTETDKAVEDLLINGLKKSFPKHEFIGEESVAAADGKIETFTDNPHGLLTPLMAQ